MSLIGCEVFDTDITVSNFFLIICFKPSLSCFISLKGLVGSK